MFSVIFVMINILFGIKLAKKVITPLSHLKPNKPRGKTKNAKNKTRHACGPCGTRNP
jgi:hypothetical protein